MPDILGIAATGMEKSLQQLDAISRNMANVSTQGYKREIAVNRPFQTYMPEQIGTAPGSEARTASNDFSAGTLQYTGSALNLAIEGKGYFQLRTPQGVVLTRNGQFQIDQRGQLISADGWPVVMQGDVIFDSTDFTVRGDGSINTRDGTRGQLELVTAEPGTLQAVAAGRYQASTTEPVKTGETRVRQGYLENSNVNTLTEMVDMIKVVRQVEASQQLMRVYDGAIDSAISTLGQF